MDILKGTATEEMSIVTLSKGSWDSRCEGIKEESLRMRRESSKSNEANFVAKIVAPREVKPGSQVGMAAVVIVKDWKLAKRIEMVETARDFLTAAHAIDMNDPALPIALSASIEGKGLFEYNIGEFFLLYGRFEGRVGTENVLTEMERLVGEDDSLKRSIRERGQVKSHPLPYVIRQTLAHFGGGNPDWKTVSREDVKQSIDLLEQWLKDITPVPAAPPGTP